jgi:hypothetical protein
MRPRLLRWPSRPNCRPLANGERWPNRAVCSATVRTLLSFTARTADYVARIFRGAAPGDLPIEQPTHYEFAVNLKTAKALNLAIPPAILARADDVIE